MATTLKTIWISNQPEGVGFDATEDYLREHAGNIVPILRKFDAAILGQNLVMDGDDDDFETLLGRICEILTHGDDDARPVHAEFRDDVGSRQMEHALILR